MRIDKRWWAVAALALAVVLFFVLDLGQYLRLSTIKSSQAQLEAWRAAQPLQTALIFFAVYVLATALSLPGAVVLTLAGGAIFGLGWGTLLISFASSIGATLAFLASRWLLGDWVQARFGERMAALNAGIAKDGAFYLFTLRLVPVVPFFVINLAMGLTRIRTLTFYAVSQLGMLAGTIVYVNAGTQLARIDSLSGIVSPGVLGSLVLLGLFPLVARKVIDTVRARKVYAKWQRPKSFDRNLVVIGAGSAGLVTAYIAAAVKAKVTLVEKHQMGGDCLHTGCVPSKALIRSARFLSHVERSKRVRHPVGHGGFRLRRRDGARAARHSRHRAARFGRALQRAGRRRRASGGRASSRPGRSRSRTTTGSKQRADHAQHRDRDRRPPVRAAPARPRPDRLLHLREHLVPARAARPHGGAGRRADRLRAGADLRAARMPRHAGREGRRACCRARTRTPPRSSPAASSPKASTCGSRTRPAASRWSTARRSSSRCTTATRSASASMRC